MEYTSAPSEVCPWQPGLSPKRRMTKARRVWLIKRSPPPLCAPRPYTNTVTGQSRVQAGQFH